MKIQQVIEKIGTYCFFIIPIIVGLLFGVLGIKGIFSKDVYLPCEATIVRIEEYYDYTAGDDNELQHRVFVDYVAEGRRFREAELGAYDSSMKEGNIINIEYKKGEPEVIQGEGAEIIPYIAAVAGLGIVGFGVFRYKKYREELAEQQ